MLLFPAEVVFVSLLFSVSPSWAAKKSENIEALSENYEYLKNRVNQLDRDQRNILGGLYTTSSKIRKISERRADLNNKMLAVNGNVKSLANVIVKLNGQISHQRVYLARRLKALFMLGEQSVMRLLVSSQSAHDLDRNMKFLKILSGEDLRVIRAYEKLKLDVKKRQDDLKREVAKLSNFKKKVQKEEDLLMREQQAKQKLIEEMKSRRKEQVLALQKIRRKGLRLAVERSDFEPWSEQFLTPFFEKKGRLPAPVAGELAEGYGVTIDADYRYKLLHKGQFYAVPTGSDVKAVAEGRVVFADDLIGYGSTVIIDHGDNYYSVYSQNSVLKVKAGDKVQGNEVIAESGVGMLKTRPGVYFEIRHFSDALDPMSWLSKGSDTNEQLENPHEKLF